VSNTAKIATLRPEMKQRAQNKSDFRFNCIFKHYVKRTLWTYTVCRTNSETCSEYVDQPIKMRRFAPHTRLCRTYTLPTGSDGADHWRILQLAVWALRARVGSHVNFPPKFRYARGGSSNTAIWFSNVTVSNIYSPHGLRWR